MRKCCSRLKCKLDNVFDFNSRTCLDQIVANDDDKKVRLGNVKYQVVDQFCYLGDMLSTSARPNASSISHIRSV